MFGKHPKTPTEVERGISDYLIKSSKTGEQDSEAEISDSVLDVTPGENSTRAQHASSNSSRPVSANTRSSRTSETVLLKEIRKIRSEMKTGFADLKKEFKETKRSMNVAHEDIAEIKSTNKNMAADLRAVEKTVNTNVNEINFIKLKLNETERRSREYNMRFIGIEEKQPGNCKKSQLVAKLL